VGENIIKKKGTQEGVLALRLSRNYMN